VIGCSQLRSSSRGAYNCTTPLLGIQGRPESSIRGCTTQPSSIYPHHSLAHQPVVVLTHPSGLLSQTQDFVLLVCAQYHNIHRAQTSVDGLCINFHLYNLTHRACYLSCQMPAHGPSYDTHKTRPLHPLR